MLELYDNRSPNILNEFQKSGLIIVLGHNVLKNKLKSKVKNKFYHIKGITESVLSHHCFIFKLHLGIKKKRLFYRMVLIIVIQNA